MKISHVISSIDKSAGGPTQSVVEMLGQLGNSACPVHINLHTAKTKRPVLEKFDQLNINVSFYNKNLIGSLISLRRGLMQEDTHIFHGHGIWQMPTHQMVRVSRTRNIPLVITPHGMLKSWSLQQKSLKKKMALKLYQYRDLEAADCIHVASEEEAYHVRLVGLKNPIAVIPNGVPVPDQIRRYQAINGNKRRVLFLSRVVPNKGIEELLKVWSELDKHYLSNWCLDIYGNADRSYLAFLTNLVRKLGIDDNARFMGPAYGVKKTEAYSNADLFVLPTYSENFGMAIAEALSFGLPVITTKGAPWQDVQENDCGWWIELEEEALASSLREALAMDRDLLHAKGLRGRAMIIEKYSSSHINQRWISLYNWLLGIDKRPDFILTS